MASCVSFKVSSDPSELKSILFLLGYQDRIKENDCDQNSFSDTTLYHATKPAVQIYKELKVMCKQLDIELKKCVITWFEDGVVVSQSPEILI